MDYFTTCVTDLRQRTVSGGTITVSGQGITFAINLVGTAILARLLAPSDFGLVAIVTAITGMATLFGDSGLSMATIQRNKIIHEQVAILFWINSGLGVLLAGLLCLLSPVIAWFYADPRLVLITVAISMSFVIRGLGVQHSALLQRNLLFFKQTGSMVTGTLLGYSAAIAGAIFGAGYWALVIQSLGTALGTSISLWLACRWRPGLPRRTTGIAGMLSFGGALTGANALNYLMRNADNLLVGWYWGATALGYYSRAYAIMMLPMSQLSSPISQVAIPALSRLQNDEKAFAQVYYNGVKAVVSLSLPLCVFMAACAEPLVLAILGKQWISTIPIFVALTPAAFLSTFTQTVGWVYNSLGRGRRQLRWTMYAVPVYLLSFTLTLPYGPVAVAGGFSVLLGLLIVPTFRFAYKDTPLRLGGLFAAVWRPIVASLMSGVLTYAALRTGALSSLGEILGLCLAAFVFGTAYISGWLILPNGREQFYELLKPLLGALKERRWRE